MNDLYKKFALKLQNGKTLLILGIVGILLIFFSSFIPTEKKNDEKPPQAFNSDNYINALEKSVKEIVKNITGNRDVSVLITLEGGPKYTYGQDSKETKESAENGQISENEFSYIIVTDSEGNEKALSVYETYPEVRGVTVVYSGSAAQKENIENAVTRALGITSKRISIINKGGN